MELIQLGPQVVGLCFWELSLGQPLVLSCCWSLLVLPFPFGVGDFPLFEVW